MPNIILDTNALIRFFTNDIPDKAEKVEKLLEEKNLFIPDVVFPELDYILRKQYGFRRERIHEIYIFLSAKPNIFTTNELKTAVKIFQETKLDMVDCFVAAYAREDSLASFDRDLLKLEGVKPFWK